MIAGFPCTRGRARVLSFFAFCVLLFVVTNFEWMTGVDFELSHYPAMQDWIPIPGMKKMLYGNPDILGATITFHDLNKLLSQENNAQLKSKKKIPKILFRTSAVEREKLSVELQKILVDSKEQNRGYQQVYFNDVDINEFITNEFPEYIKAYQSLVPGAYKADLFRLLALYKYGGIYNDIGHRFLVPIEQLLDANDEFIAATEVSRHGSYAHALYNGILAAYPSHPIIKFMIDDIVYTIMHCNYMADPLDITGPAAIGRAFNKFMRDWNPGYTGTAPTWDRMPIRRGNYRHKGYQIKLLQHNPRKEKIYDGVKGVIRTKFPSYYSKIYKEQGERYDSLWRQRRVFSESAACDGAGK